VRINNIRKDDAAGHDFILQETCDVSRPRVWANYLATVKSNTRTPAIWQMSVWVGFLWLKSRFFLALCYWTY
jgi:hypothetical protein